MFDPIAHGKLMSTVRPELWRHDGARRRPDRSGLRVDTEHECSPSSRRTRWSGSTRLPSKSRSTSRPSMPKTVLVGLAETAVKESTHRVERAVVNSGYHAADRPRRHQPRPRRPQEGRQRLRPADRPGLLLGSGQVVVERPGNFAVVGELALTGETRPIKGVLAMALQPRSRRVATGCSSRPPTPPRPPSSRDQRLPDRQPRRGGRVSLRPARHGPSSRRPRRGLPPASHTRGRLLDVKGQDYAKRALLIAAARRSITF